MIARPITLFAALLGACFLLSGCALIKAAEEPTDLYQVSPKSTFDPDLPTVQWQLAVDVPAAAANLNTGRIAISPSPTSSDYYAKTAWTDRAPLMVQTRIVDSFENSHKIVAVNSGAGGGEVLARVDLLYTWIQMKIASHGGGGNVPIPDGGVPTLDAGTGSADAGSKPDASPTPTPAPAVDAGAKVATPKPKKPKDPCASNMGIQGKKLRLR